MARLGYMVTDLPGQYINEDEQRMQKENCDKIYREKYTREGDTTELKKLMGDLAHGDEVFFLSMANAFRGVRKLCMFLEFSRIRKIRVVFLRDRIDSKEEIFQPSTESVLNAVGSLTEDSFAIRKVRKLSERKDTEKARSKQERNKRCIEMYKKGIPVEEIQKQTGFRSKSSIFRILKNNGIILERRKKNELE